MQSLAAIYLCVTLAAAGADSSTGSSAMARWQPGPRDTIEVAIIGLWTSKQAPNDVVSITASGRGAFAIAAEHRFLGAGLFDGSDFVAVMRSPLDPKDGVARGIGVLRAHFTGPDAMEVEFCDDRGAKPTSRENWTRSGRFGKWIEHPPADSLPRFNDYVFVEELPEAIEKVPPDYPQLARKKNIEGTVVVQALVGKDGRVKDAKVVQSIPELDDYAVVAVKQWRFIPAKSKGQPVAVWVAIPVMFTLH